MKMFQLSLIWTLSLLTRLAVQPVPLVLVGVLSLGGAARAETFDLTTYAPPAGTRSDGPEAVSFVDAGRTTFAVYGVYKSAPSTGDPARDFQDEWGLLVANPFRVTSELKTETVDIPRGWKMTMGSARVWSEQQRNFVALMTVFTGHGVKATVLVNYNDDLYRPKIDQFLASIQVNPPALDAMGKAPLPPRARLGPSAQESGAAPLLTANEWYRAVASTWDTSGYLRYRYRFLADGSYRFLKEWWSQYDHTNYWFIEESGRYRQDPTTIQLSPTSAVKIQRDKTGNQKAKPEPVALEPTTYRYAFQQLNKLNLILTPESGQPTDRDGKSFSFAGQGKSYYYEPPSRCEQRPAPTDCP